VAEGEDGLCLTVAEEEVDTDAFDEEVERFIHVVGEGDGYFVMSCSRREVEDVMEASRAIEILSGGRLEGVQYGGEGCCWWEGDG